jgi:hypothetical protein
VKKPKETKREKLVRYIKLHNTFYTYENFALYPIKDLEQIKKEIENSLKNKK